MSTVSAVANGVRMSPRKIGLVAGLVRGRTVSDALTILEHTPKRTAEPLQKVINSAVANAVHNAKMDKGSLVIEQLHVGPGIIMKRFRPAAMGHALPYKRRSSNIRVVLTAQEQTESSKNAAKPMSKTTSSRKQAEKTEPES